GVGKLFGEREQEAIELAGIGLGGVDLVGEPAGGVAEDIGVDLAAILRDERVREFVDEAHGEECTRVVNGGGVGIGPAGLVQRLGELAAGSDVGEDDVAGVAEQRFIDVGR